jgi:hypothetical protein
LKKSVGARPCQTVSNIKSNKVTRKELKRLLKNHTSSGDKVELLNWLLTEKFDDELEQFITEDLTAELLNSHTDNEIDADVMISRILSKAEKEIKRED